MYSTERAPGQLWMSFCWVKEAGNPSCVRQAGGDDETAFVHAPRPAREKALARIPATSPFPLERIEQADLPAVGMTGKNQVNSVRHQRGILDDGYTIQ